MKNVMIIALLLSGLTLVQSCSKEEGPVGPQGPTGATGATGAAGQNGVSGAVAFEFTSQASTFNQSMTISAGKVDSSAVMVYYKDADLGQDLWYTAPGLGANGAYQTRYYLQVSPSSTTINMNIYNPDGSSYSGAAVTFSRVKVVFIPHTLFGKKAPVDYSDYKATMRYYGLQE